MAIGVVRVRVSPLRAVRRVSEGCGGGWSSDRNWIGVGSLGMVMRRVTAVGRDGGQVAGIQGALSAAWVRTSSMFWPCRTAVAV